METDRGRVYELFAQFSKKVESPPKNKTAGSGSFAYKYADLADVRNCVSKALPDGLGWTQNVESDAQGVSIETIFFADDGSQMSSGKLVLPIAAGGKMSNVQAIGSTITYGRRYQLSAMAGIASEEDTDANIESSPRRVVKKCSKNVAKPEQIEKVRAMFADLAKLQQKDFETVLKEHNSTEDSIAKYSATQANHAIEKIGDEIAKMKAAVEE